MEQRVVDTQTAFPETITSLPVNVRNEMADGDWSVKNQLMKPVLLQQVQWSAADARDSEIIEFSFPNVLTKVNSLVSQTLSLYSFYKMSPVFRIQINATTFNGGQLICSFDPFSYQKDVYDTTKIPSNFYLATQFSATMLPHVRILASDSEPVELKLPFIHPHSYLTTNSNSNTLFNNLGTFRVTVLNPFTVPDGAKNSATVSVWMYANDAEVYVPIGRHDPILENFNATLAIKANKPLLEETAGIVAGAVAANALGNLLTGNKGKNLSLGGIVKDVVNATLDYPSDPVNPPNTIAPIENLALGKGKNRSSRLAIDPMSLNPSPDDVIGETMEAMNLSSIISTPSLLFQGVLKSTDPVGSKLFDIPVHPSLSPTLFSPNTEVLVTQPTYLSFISNAFLYWSGAIKFDIEIVATKYHVGKMLIAFVPSDADPDSLTFEYASSDCPNVIIDITQSSNVTFSVPFNSHIPMKSTRLTTTLSPKVVNGHIACFVFNALNNPTNVSSQIEYNVYIYADSDFNFYVPCRPNFNTSLFKPPPSLEETSGISIQSSSNQPHKTVVYLSKDKNHTTPRPHFGEVYSLQDIIRRFSYKYSGDLVILDNQTFTTKVFAVTPQERELSTSANYLAYFSLMYSAWTGSIRYKYVYKTNRMNKNQASIYHAPDATRDDLFFSSAVNYYLANLASQGYGMYKTNLSQHSSIEIEVPFYSPYNMLLTKDVSGYTDNGQLRLIYEKTSTDAADDIVEYTLYTAAGEDFRFIYKRAPPLNVLTSNEYKLNPLMSS